MVVLIVANGVPDGAKSLDGIFEFDQARALTEEGESVIFFGVDLRSIRHKRKLGISKGVKGGVKWYRIAIPLGNIPLTWLCKIGTQGLLYLYRKVFGTQGSPDIIHAHFTEPGYMASILAKKYNIPLVITEHSSQIMKCPLKKGLFKIAKSAYGSANQIITVSTALSSKINHDYGYSTIVISNIIDTALFSKVQFTEHQGFNVVVVAGLVEGKRIDRLIDALTVLSKKIPEISLHIVGDGPLREQLEGKVSKLLIRDNIKFYGSLARKEIAEVFSICDCFALLSAAETFGVVYVEAMAAGLPVIGTRCGGPEDFVNEENGILVGVDNVKAAADAIEYVYMHRNIYQSGVIKAYARDHFSPKYIASQIINIYNSVLSNGKG